MRVEAIRCSARENNRLLWMLKQCPVSDFPVQHIHARYTQKREPLAISLSKDGITFDRSYAVVNTTQRKRCVPRTKLYSCWTNMQPIANVSICRACSLAA